MHDPGTGLTFDPVVVERLAAALHEMALRWLSSAPAPASTPGVFGTDPSGAELSAALPVFLARVLEARHACCALLAASETALARAAAALDESGRSARPDGPQ